MVPWPFLIFPYLEHFAQGYESVIWPFNAVGQNQDFNNIFSIIVFLFPASQQDVFMFGHKTTMARMIGNDVPLVGLAGKPPGKQFISGPR